MTDGRTFEALKSKNSRLILISKLKGGGYLTSTISVFLLAVPGFKAATLALAPARAEGEKILRA